MLLYVFCVFSKQAEQHRHEVLAEVWVLICLIQNLVEELLELLYALFKFFGRRKSTVAWHLLKSKCFELEV